MLAISATPVTSVTLATSERAVILATVVIRVTLVTLVILVTSATLVIIETLESQYHPAVRQRGRLPQRSLQAQRDYSRRSLGHNPRCPNHHRQPNLHGALSMLHPASCSK